MCVLRASGDGFDVDAFLADSPWDIGSVHRKGELQFPTLRPDGSRWVDSGFNVDVSEASWSDLPAQVQDAEAFLRTFEEEIQRLQAFPGCEGAVLDFPVESRIGPDGAVPQFDRFPASLVALAGALRLALELSIYPCEEEDSALESSESS